MSRISLRTYHREIESLIERGQYDQAIAHCKHIIQSFPKSISTYRLLGKCFLENQHYSDAADIFQRVLSSVPDDFLSHVGLSMIREDEGNLNDAIWNMERAFEVQPANNAIQAELRRLYGRRDGYEPPKLRLTRGALARMYVKGELYQQAIAEIRAALGEEPDRLDLQTLLAEAYFASGKRVEAAETCSAILSKLPFSLSANRLLAEILADSERASEAGAYRKRVLDLDPYSAHVSPVAPSADHVPDETITVERLSWRPGQTGPLDSSQPDWASSLGVQLNHDRVIDDDIPDWLISAADAAPPSMGKSGDSAQASNVFLFDDDELEGKQQEGATPAIASEEEQDFLALFDSESPEDDEDEDAETFDFGTGDILPDWMSDPNWGSSEAEAPEEPQAGADEPSTVGEPVSPDEEMSASPPLASESLDFSSEQDEEIPEWLQSLGGAEDEAAPQSPPEDVPASPSWLDTEDVDLTDDDKTILEPVDADDLSSEPEQSIPDEISAESDEDLPEWLKELDMGEKIQPGEDLGAGSRTPEENVDTPEVFSESPQGEIPESETEIAPGEIPDWLQGLQPEVIEPDTPAAMLEETEQISEEEQEAAFAWLEGLAARQGADEDELSVSAEERPDAPPEWLQAESEAGFDEGAPGAVELSISEELQDISPEPEGVSSQIEPESVEEDEGDLSEWIVATSVGAAAVESALSSEEEQEVSSSEEMPEWLQEMAEEEITQAAAELEPDLLEDSESIEGEAAAVEGEIPEWMQSLAPQGESEPQEEVSIEGEDVPDWLIEASDQDQEAISASLEFPHEGETEEIEITQPEVLDTFDLEQPVEPESEVPEWMQEAPQAPAEEIASVEAEIELPDWLMEVAEEAAESADDELPDWLAEPETAADLAAQANEFERQLEEAPEFEGLLSLGDEPPISEEDTQPSSFVLTSDRGEPPAEIPIPESITPEPTQPEEWVSEEPEPVAEASPGDFELEDALAEPQDAQAEEPELDLSEYEAPTLVSSAIHEEEEIAVEEPVEEPVLDETPEMVIPDLDQELVQPGLEDEDAAFAWLESLAAKQGVEEALLLSPEERREEPPDWVKEAAASAIEAEVADETLQEAEEKALSQETAAQLEDEETLADLQPVEMEAEDTGWEEETLLPEAEAAIPTEGFVEEMDVEVEAEADLPGESESLEAPELEEELEIQEEFPPEEIPVSPEAQEAEAEEIPELPDWLADLEEPPTQAEPVWRQAVESAPMEPVDINAAGLADLERLPGIGFVRAQAILAYRRAHGPLRSEADLLNVEGFDADLLEGLAGRINYAETGELPAEEVQAEQETEVHISLTQARNALVQGDISTAVARYQELIEDEQCLPDVITDLHEAIFQNPTDLDIIQSLGDAYLRNGQIKDALEAYNKAQQLLR